MERYNFLVRENYRLRKEITRLEGKVGTLEQKVAAQAVDLAAQAVDLAAIKKIVTDLKRSQDRFQAIRSVADMMRMFSQNFFVTPYGSFFEHFSVRWKQIKEGDDSDDDDTTDGEIPPGFEQEVKLLLKNFTSLDESWSSDITLLMAMKYERNLASHDVQIRSVKAQKKFVENFKVDELCLEHEEREAVSRALQKLKQLPNFKRLKEPSF